MNTQKQTFLIVVLFFLLVGGCGAYSFIDPIRAERQDDFFEAESIRRGALLYANNCRTCHGITGQGGVGLPLNTNDLKVQDPLQLEANQEMIRTTLYCGRAGTQMPPWLNDNGGALTANQIEHLIRLITAPVTNLDESGEPAEHPNRGWEEAEEFAHNLNAESTAIVGGDTLDIIALEHGVGPQQLADALGLATTDVFLEDDEVALPAPLDGRVFVVEDDEGVTVEDIAETVHLGAIIIADLNELDYELDDEYTFTLIADGEPVPGLEPGTTLQLPEGAAFTISAGDTLQGIADMHGVAVDEIAALNEGLPDDPEAELEARFAVAIPDGYQYFANAATSWDAIAGLHAVGEPDGSVLEDLGADELAELNGAEAGDGVPQGTFIDLPEGTHRIAAEGDTLAAYGETYGNLEGIIAANSDLADIDPNAELPTVVTLALPPIDAYVVQGQSLDDVARTLSGVTAEGLAEANGLSGADAVVRVGTSLGYPEDAWGTAPPDTLTSPSVCIEHTLPQTLYEELPGAVEGGGDGPFEPEAPEEVTENLEIAAGSNEWYVISDGNEQEPNRGVALIAPGTEVTFTNRAGVHTITVDGEIAAENLMAEGDTRTVTFDEPGEYEITCDFHPAMLAYVFVGE